MIAFILLLIFSDTSVVQDSSTEPKKGLADNIATTPAAPLGLLQTQTAVKTDPGFLLNGLQIRLRLKRGADSELQIEIRNPKRLLLRRLLLLLFLMMVIVGTSGGCFFAAALLVI